MRRAKRRSIMKIDAEFLGWQETNQGDIFPLYNIVREGHPSHGSTVSEDTLTELQLQIPRTPSPYPDVGPSPWHRLGTELVNVSTAREVIEIAGLDYKVARKPLKVSVKPNQLENVPHRLATVRADTGKVLGIVGDEYIPIQNRDAFAFFDNLVDLNEALYETAGTFGQGKRIWILAKLPGFIKVRGKDIVNKYLLLTNSHDGSSGVRVKLTPIRMVCNNTLAAALRGAGEVDIRHTTDLTSGVQQARSLIGMANFLFNQLEVVFNRMSLMKITEKQLLEYVKRLIPDTADDGKVEGGEVRKAVLNLYETGRGADLSRGTLWGAFNSITEFTDHAMEGNPSARLESNWFGRGEQLKLKAFRLAEQMI